MAKMLRLIVISLSFFADILTISAQNCIVTSFEYHTNLLPVHLIDSINVQPFGRFDICVADTMLYADSVFFDRYIPDTLVIDYEDGQVYVQNPRTLQLQTSVLQSDVTVKGQGVEPFVCLIKGYCNDGRLVIDCDTTCTLILDNLNLTSRHSSAICVKQKQKVKLILPDNSESRLTDGFIYQTDSTDTSNGCLYTKGSLTIEGGGTLSVVGNYRHGISSGKNVTMTDGHIIIHEAQKDGLHCDKLQMRGGLLSVYLKSDASKGVKCKEDFIMKGGTIEGEAHGSVVIESGETSYCSLLKCGGNMTIEDGIVSLTHYGQGGRCISADGNLRILGGTFNLENHGHGGSYLTAEQDIDYYTPKCITADGNMNIERGQFHLLATGDGGKGIDCSDTLFIGRKEDDFIPADSLLIDIETQGTALVDNVEEDFRKGCPKAIKADKDLELYSGNLNIVTKGQGGEGIESKETLCAHHVSIIADTYDDCFNTGVCCHIDGAHIYCLSHNNDGIDSNGSIIISDGIVASVNQKKPNECFDTEDGQLYLLGGTVFGIGSGPVDVKQALYPYYSTPYGDEDAWIRSNGLILNTGKYVYVRKGETAYMALRNDNEAFRSFITVASPAFEEGEAFTISEGDRPIDAQENYFGERLFFDCFPLNTRDVIDESFAIK